MTHASLNSDRSPAPPMALVIGAFAAVYFVWGSTYLAIHYGIKSFPPFLMGGTRFLFAGLLLYAFMRLRKRPRPSASNWWAAARVGTLMLVGGNGLVCWAQQNVASGLAALMIATVPLWIVLFDWLVFRGPRPVSRVVLGLVGGLVGLAVLVGPANIGGDRIHFGGSIALMFACVFWSFGSLHSRRSNLARCPFLSTATQMIAGGVSFIVVGSLSGEWSQLDLAAVSWESVKAVAYLSIFGSILALTAYTWLLRVVEPARVATYAYVNPVVAMLLGWAWLGETLSPRSMVASAIILGSVVLITTARARAANRNATGKAPSPTPDELRVDERQQDFEVASPRCVSGDKATCTL